MSDDYDELLRLHEAATPGEWRTSLWEEQHEWEIVHTGAPDSVVAGEDCALAGYLSEADAALICAMRNALPGIVERVKAAESAARVSEAGNAFGKVAVKERDYERHMRNKAEAKNARLVAELAHLTNSIDNVATGDGFTTEIRGVKIQRCNESGLTDTDLRLVAAEAENARLTAELAEAGQRTIEAVRENNQRHIDDTIVTHTSHLASVQRLEDDIASLRWQLDRERAEVKRLTDGIKEILAEHWDWKAGRSLYARVEALLAGGGE